MCYFFVFCVHIRNCDLPLFLVTVSVDGEEACDYSHFPSKSLTEQVARFQVTVDQCDLHVNNFSSITRTTVSVKESEGRKRMAMIKNLKNENSFCTYASSFVMTRRVGCYKVLQLDQCL